MGHAMPSQQQDLNARLTQASRWGAAYRRPRTPVAPGPESGAQRASADAIIYRFAAPQHPARRS